MVPGAGDQGWACERKLLRKEGEDVPESVIEAFAVKIVVSKDGFDWYLRFDGDPDKPRHCKLEGKRKSTTKVVVTQDFSPALDSSNTGCYQGLIRKPNIALIAPRKRGGFLWPFIQVKTVWNPVVNRESAG